MVCVFILVDLSAILRIYINSEFILFIRWLLNSEQKTNMFSKQSLCTQPNDQRKSSMFASLSLYMPSVWLIISFCLTRDIADSVCSMLVSSKTLER